MTISLGSTNFACISPKEVLTEAVKMGAPKIILVHNHPSGDSTPSKEDVILTKKIKEISIIHGIKFIDHVIK